MYIKHPAAATTDEQRTVHPGSPTLGEAHLTSAFCWPSLSRVQRQNLSNVLTPAPLRGSITAVASELIFARLNNKEAKQQTTDQKRALPFNEFRYEKSFSSGIDAGEDTAPQH